MYKVSLQSKGKFSSADYTGKVAVLLVSVGKEYHEGEKLLRTVEKINDVGFGKCIVAVADSL